MPYGFQQVQRLIAVYQLGAVFAGNTSRRRCCSRDPHRCTRRRLVAHAAALTDAVDRVGELLVRVSCRGVPAVAESRATPGRLIVVFSAKGGVGKSTIATNVAAAMARSLDDTVSLMDADMQFGDISVMLGIPPDHTVVDAAASIHYADPELMRNLVTPARERAAWCCRRRLSRRCRPASRRTRWSACAAACRAISGFVVVDTPTTFDDTTLGLARDGRRRVARGLDGHPERQEPQDRDAGARPDGDRRTEAAPRA